MGVFRYLDRWQGSIRDVWNREDQRKKGDQHAYSHDIRLFLQHGISRCMMKRRRHR